MQIDAVHDIQHAYREIVRATAYPGTVVDLSAETSRVDIETDFPRPLIMLAMMLVDAEVGFCVAGRDPEASGALISQLTYSRQVAPEDAAFLFFARTGALPIEELVGRSRIGTLEDPQLGATIVLECTSLEAAGMEAVSVPPTLRLTGPGIPESAYLRVAETDWIAPRAARNAEYPLGIDMMLITPEGYLASIPRTTQIEEL